MNAPTCLIRARGETTRRARITHCPRCRAVTLRGLDADTAALAATVDPTPIDQLEEARQLLAGRHTYDLNRGDNRLELDHRTSTRIASPKRGTVLVEHRCGAPPTPANDPPRPPRPIAADNDRPPF